MEQEREERPVGAGRRSRGDEEWGVDEPSRDEKCDEHSALFQLGSYPINQSSESTTTATQTSAEKDFPRMRQADGAMMPPSSP